MEKENIVFYNVMKMNMIILCGNELFFKKEDKIPQGITLDISAFQYSKIVI